MKKWENSVFLLICLVCCFFSTVVVHADEPEQVKGLTATDWLDWEGVVRPNENAEFGKEIWMTLSGAGMCFRYVDESGNQKDVTKEKLRITDSEGNVTEDVLCNEIEEVENRSILDIVCRKTGDYKIFYEEDNDPIILHVGTAYAGFYSENNVQDESYLREFFYDNPQANTFYLIFNTPEDESITYGAPVFKVDDRGEEITGEGVSRYITSEKVGKDVYKIAVNAEGAGEGFSLNAKVDVDDAENEGRQEDTWIYIEYRGTPVGLVVTDQLNWEATPLAPAEDAEFYKNMGADLRGNIYYLAYFDEEGNKTPVSLSEISVTDENGNSALDVVSFNQEGDGSQCVDFFFKKTGRYRVYDQDKVSYITIEVDYPRIGFYSSDSASENGFIHFQDGWKYGAEVNQTFYLVLHPLEGETVTLSEQPFGIWDKERDEEVPMDAVNQYITYRKKKDNVYEITVKLQKDFELYAHSEAQNGDDRWNESVAIDLSYDAGLKPPKKNLDMSKAVWNYKEAFTYDGKEKKVELTGLPAGLTVTYTGNTATEPGTYTAKASFTYDQTKYNAPDVSKIKELQWSIIKKRQDSTPSNVKSGDKVLIGEVTYLVTSAAGGKKTVSYVGKKQKTSKENIPSVVTIDGEAYKVTAIADNAFSGNNKLSSVTISANVTKIGKNAFKNCTKLKKVTIPKNVTELGNNAFYNCKKITSVKFSGTKLTKIGAGTFRKCSSLKSVVIPKNVTEIGKNAFKDCKKLNRVTVKGTKLKKIGKDAFKNIAKNSVIKVPKKKKAAYKKLFKKAGYKRIVK